jgi:hypothetical protein
MKNLKTPIHASSTRKATRPKLSVGQGNMVTLALTRRRVGALVTQTLVALSTIYT